MLVLSRKVGERVKIETSDGPIWVAPVRVQGDKVRLGIDAPDACKVLREELQPRDNVVTTTPTQAAAPVAGAAEA